MVVALTVITMTLIILLSAVALFAVAIIVTRTIEHFLTARLELWAETCEVEPASIEVEDRDIVFAMPAKLARATRPLRTLAI